jgi:hypothetical protein
MTGVRGREEKNRKLGDDLRSQTVTSQVPSAQEGLTTGFEMGPGVPPPLETPREGCSAHLSSSPPADTARGRDKTQALKNTTFAFCTRPHTLFFVWVRLGDVGNARRSHPTRPTKSRQEQAALVCYNRSPRPLVLVSCTHYCASTPNLSSRWSACGLTRLPGEGTHLETCFLLRCFQQLSPPESATERCTWQYNSHTGAPSTPVLSY